MRVKKLGVLFAAAIFALAFAGCSSSTATPAPAVGTPVVAPASPAA
jgi:hypothetical protein